MYEKPEMDVIELDLREVITLSGESGGDGDSYEGSWSN